MNNDDMNINVDFVNALNVFVIEDNKNELLKFIDDNKEKESHSFSINYPVVYIHYWPTNAKAKIKIYIGESNDLYKRTMQHYAQSKTKQKNDWHKNINNNNSRLIVITNKYFTKSSVLDFEHRLIKLSSANENIHKVYNGRGNPQGRYYTSDNLEESFRSIWDKLIIKTQEEEKGANISKNLFPSYDSLIHSAIYKASPFISLSPEQLDIKNRIVNQVYSNISKQYKPNTEGEIMIVKGDAGTGKSILISNTFYDLISCYDDMQNDDANLVINKCAIVVNHKEQKQLFKNIFDKFLNFAKGTDCDDRYNKIVFRSTEFLNQFKNENCKKGKKRKGIFKADERYDIVFVDEAHLLLTRKNQGYLIDDTQLNAIRRHAKVVVAVFDNKQVLDNNSNIDNAMINQYIEDMKKKGIEPCNLKKQWRILPNEKNEEYKTKICEWIDSFVYDGLVKDIVQSDYNIKENYIRVFDNPNELFEAIKEKASCEESRLSRLIATYDWEYVDARAPSFDDMWSVNIKEENFTMPWNYEYNGRNKLDVLNNPEYQSDHYKKSISNLTWIEQKHTINEIGSTYTIQGFDLDYAGLIIGNSVKFKNGKVVIYPSESKCSSAVEKKHSENSEKFLRNQLNVLMKRGVKGLYIYACDKELRNKLQTSIK